MIFAAFGSEHAERPGWSRPRRLFIRIFGVVDLPTRIRARCIRRVLRGRKFDCVLDFGCGTGVYAFYLTRQRGCEAVAVDVDTERVESIREIASSLGRRQVTAINGDESVLSTLPKGGFSAVLAIESLQYTRSLAYALAKFNGCLGIGGLLVVHVPLRESLWPYEQTLFTEEMICENVRRSGFELVCCHRTFGRAAQRLCAIYSLCARQIGLLPIIYPLLLLVVRMLPPFVKAGNACLVVARKVH